MTVEVYGRCDDKLSGLKAVIASSVEAGTDVGASVAVSLNGEVVADLWAGHLDEGRTQPWQEDSIVNVYSTTKTMSFLCALILADRGELDFDERVSRYWPEFAAAGKGDIPVWHLMNHAAGLSGLDEPVTATDMYDWDKICTLLAAQAPWWEPGTASGYHAITQGYLIGEVVRRITGQTIGEFFASEIAGPLGADFFIGVPDSEFGRIGNLIPPADTAASSDADPDSIAARTFRNPPVDARDSWTAEWRRAEIPAANGHGNARSVALIQSIVANMGEARGKRLISEETARSVMIERINGPDHVLGIPVRFGLGYGLNSTQAPLSPNPNTCYWGGWGGSVILIDQDARLAISFVMNKMHAGLMGDPRSANIIGEVYSALMG